MVQCAKPFSLLSVGTGVSLLRLMAQWWDWWLSIVTNGSVVGLVAQYWD
jgi:hypothetical protein